MAKDATLSRWGITIPRGCVKRNSVSRVVIPDLTLPGNPGSNLTLVTVIEIRFVFGDESRILPRI